MSQTATPPDDIAFVLALPPDRQAAVFAALVRRLGGDKPTAALAVTDPDGQPLGTVIPPLSREQFRTLVDSLAPNMPPISNRPLPPGIDLGDPDNWATDEELDALTEQARA
jgi:hypothetical protein